MDLPARGWWSGDLHVHMNYGGAYRNDPARLRAQAEAEDLHVVENLIVNKEQRIPDVAFFRGSLDPVSTATTLVRHDEEYHTSWWGHTGHLGLTRTPDPAQLRGVRRHGRGEPLPRQLDDLRPRARAGRRLRLRPSLRSAGARPERPRRADERAAGRRRARQERLPRGRGLLGSPHHGGRLVPAAQLRIPHPRRSAAPTRWPTTPRCAGPVGMNRVFVRSGAKLDYRAWLAGLKAGKTLRIERTPPVLHARRPRGRATRSRCLRGPHPHGEVELRSLVPVEKLEVVSNGVVVATVPLSEGGTRADATIPISVAAERLVCRCAPGRPARSSPCSTSTRIATTSPIYVTVKGRPVRSAVGCPLLRALDRAPRGGRGRARGLERRDGKGGSSGSIGVCEGCLSGPGRRGGPLAGPGFGRAPPTLESVRVRRAEGRTS